MKTASLKKVIIILAFLLSLFIQITSEYNYEINNIKNLNSELYSDNALSFVCTKTLNLKKVSSTLPVKSIIYSDITSENNQIIRGVFLNSNNAVKTLIDGSFFSPDDIMNEKNVAVVGKNIVCTEENQKKYVNLKNKKYEVIGTLGSKNAESKMDNVILIPLTQDIINHFQNEFIICYDDYEEIIAFLSNENLFGDVLINSSNRPNILKTVNISNKQIIVPVLLIIDIYLIFVFTTIEWPKSRKNEFYIKQMNGFKFKQIFLKSIMEYAIMCFISSLISCSIVTIVNGLKLGNIIKNLIFVIIICLFNLVVLLIIWKINKKRII